jgi:hypothetical protein
VPEGGAKVPPLLFCLQIYADERRSKDKLAAKEREKTRIKLKMCFSQTGFEQIRFCSR